MVTGVVTSALALMAAAKPIAHVDIATITVFFIVDFFLPLVSPAFLFRTTFIIKRFRCTRCCQEWNATLAGGSGESGRKGRVHPWKAMPPIRCSRPRAYLHLTRRFAWFLNPEETLRMRNRLA